MSSSKVQGFERRLRVRGYEMDASGFVPVSNLARYGEHVRWDGLRDPELGLHKHWQRGVLRAQRLQLFGKVVYDAELRLDLWVARVGRTSFELAQRIQRSSDGSLVALVSATIVNLGSDGRPAPVGAEMAELLGEGPLPEPVELGREEPPSAGPVFTREFVVRPSDQDVLQHVNHARYLDFIEDTRWFAARAEPFASDTLAGVPAPAHVAIAYEREATAGDALTVTMWASAAGVYDFQIRRPHDGSLLTRARVRTAR